MDPTGSSSSPLDFALVSALACSWVGASSGASSAREGLEDKSKNSGSTLDLRRKVARVGKIVHKLGLTAGAKSCLAWHTWNMMSDEVNWLYFDLRTTRAYFVIFALHERMAV